MTEVLLGVAIIVVFVVMVSGCSDTSDDTTSVATTSPGTRVIPACGNRSTVLTRFTDLGERFAE